MCHPGRILMLGLFLLVVVGTLGCQGPPPSRMALNDRMALTNQRIAAAAGSFRKALSPLKDNKAMDVSSARQNLDAVQAAITEAKREFQDMPLPARESSNAPAFLDAYKEFLKTQDDLCSKHLQNAMRLAMTGGAGAWAQIEAEFQAVGAAEQIALDKLKAVQKSYAEEHNYKLVKKR